MTEREKLIELVCEGLAVECGTDCKEPQKSYCQKCHNVADHLLAMGVSLRIFGKAVLNDGKEENKSKVY